MKLIYSFHNRLQNSATLVPKQTRLYTQRHSRMNVYTHALPRFHYAGDAAARDTPSVLLCHQDQVISCSRVNKPEVGYKFSSES